MTTSSAPDLPNYTQSNNVDWNEARAILPADLYRGLVGRSFQMTLRRSADDSSSVLDLIDTISADSLGNPILRIRYPEAKLSKLLPAVYVRDIRAFWGGTIIYLGRGSVEIVRGIAREAIA